MKATSYIALAILFTVSALAQRRPIPITETHSRLWVLDRVVQDAKAHTRKPAHASDDGVLGFVAIYSRDGQHVLCEYVFKESKHQAALRSDVASGADPHMTVWDKSKTPLAVFEAQAKALGFTDVDLKRLAVGVR